MSPEQLTSAFGPYRKPNEVTIPKYEKIQSKVLELATLINDECPESREKSLALTDLQGVKMWANAAVAIHTPEPVAPEEPKQDGSPITEGETHGS